ncbi:hypothetical protein GN956_G24943 [Arapaima gigas]
MKDIWIRTIFSLLTAVLLCGKPVQGQCSVVQPDQVHVASIGSPVTLNCSFQLPANVEQFRMSWRHSLTNHGNCSGPLGILSSIVQTNTKNKTEEDPEGEFRMVTGPNWSQLSLKRFKLEDSGMYICHIIMEIPMLSVCCGNGTKVEMGTRQTQETGVHGNWWIWLVVGMGAIVVAFATLGFFIFGKKREAADSTYVNISHTQRQAPAGTPRCLRAHPKSLEELSVPKRPPNTNSLKA